MDLPWHLSSFVVPLAAGVAAIIRYRRYLPKGMKDGA